MKAPCLRGNAGRAPSLHYTLAFALQLRKSHGKNLSQGSRKVPGGHDSINRLGGCFSRLDRLSNFLQPWLELQVTRVNPRSAQVSAEFAN